MGFSCSSEVGLRTLLLEEAWAAGRARRLRVNLWARLRGRIEAGLARRVSRNCPVEAVMIGDEF
jgi:hypothetical protein